MAFRTKLIGTIVATALALCLSLGGAGVAAGTGNENEIKAALIYKISKFVIWPDAALAPDTDFTLCVLGSDALGGHLANVGGKTTQGRKIVVRPVEQPSPGNGCHILWLSRSHAAEIPEVLGRLAYLPVLTISDSSDFAENGGTIGLVARNNRISFNINLTASRRAGVEISSQLLDLARIVD